MSSVVLTSFARNIFVAGVVLAVAAGTANAQVRIVQTNSGGDNIHLIDPSTNMIVAEIKGVPVNHGAAAAPDGKRFYFSSEAEQTLEKLVTRIKVGSSPKRNITVTMR